MRSLKKYIIGLISAFVLLLAGIIGSFGFVNAAPFTLSNGSKPHLIISDITDNNSSPFIALPGRNGHFAKKVENTGDGSGNLSVSFSQVINVPGVDGKGDLGTNTEIAAFLDSNSNGIWDTGDIGLCADGSLYKSGTLLKYNLLNSFSGVMWNNVQALNPASATALVIMWQVPAETGTEIQGDSISFSNSFTLQGRIP
jgi:hypothetical protein